MKQRNTLAFSRKNGGGNFDQSELTVGLHTYKEGQFASNEGRLSAFLETLVVVLFVFTSALPLTACSSSDEEAGDSPTAADYQSLLTAHDWEVTQAAQRLNGFLIDQKEADLYCHFSPASVFFSEGAMVNYFDDEGKVTQSRYEYSPIGGAPYFIKGEQIEIEDQGFNINEKINNGDSLFVLANEEWKLVLKKKQPQDKERERNNQAEIRKKYQNK